MSEEHQTGQDETASGQRGFDWRPLAWIVLGVALVLVVASFFGNGTGMFGWGWMMGMMWLWMLLPLILIGILVYVLVDYQQRAGRRDHP